MQIQPNERDKIAVWFGSGITLREIARRLGRDVSVISRELKRNCWGDSYQAIHAQNLANKRNHQVKKKCWWQKHELYSYVIEKLRNGWSPEQISGWLKLESSQKIIS
jgi:IS30 family transposase